MPFGQPANGAQSGANPSEPRRNCFCAGSVSKSRASMAESTSAAPVAAPIPSSAEIERAEKFARERFLFDGEQAATALAPGSPRRTALDQALAELEADPRAKGP